MNPPIPQNLFTTVEGHYWKFKKFQLGEPPATSNLDTPSCNPHSDPPIYGDCWYNCTSDDISGEEKRHRL
ncbi:hypothetical protein L2E82_08509 [Cichorium intybus]|uniref:Uncharacterized protein n=1 Tax=Cichorium intybus TaxID=13427 RepID=A0ACB9G6L6_CICIN|nr:hypothetical protein L2E82_08509 [Cichorium intybus]